MKKVAAHRTRLSPFVVSDGAICGPCIRWQAGGGAGDSQSLLSLTVHQVWRIAAHLALSESRDDEPTNPHMTHVVGPPPVAQALPPPPPHSRWLLRVARGAVRGKMNGCKGQQQEGRRGRHRERAASVCEHDAVLHPVLLVLRDALGDPQNVANLLLSARQPQEAHNQRLKGELIGEASIAAAQGMTRSA